MITKFKQKDWVRMKPSVKKQRIVSPLLTKQGVFGIVLATDINERKTIYRVTWYNKNCELLGAYYRNTLFDERYLMMKKRFVRRHPLTNIFRDKK